MFGGEQRGVRRAHSPDDYEEQQVKQEQDHQQHGNNFNNSYRRGPPGQSWSGNRGRFGKRHRPDNYAPPPPVTLEDRIAQLGETGSRNMDIGNLVKSLDVELMGRNHDEERITALTSKICRCIVSFPTRIGVYATLIGLIKVKHNNLGCQIIDTLHASYPVYLEAQKWQEALTIIQLLSSLVNCRVIHPSALVSQYEFLLESTFEDNIPQARSDYFVYTVLSSLPYVAQELATNPESKENFEKILSTIEAYLTKRSKEHLNVIRVWISDDSTVQMDYLDSLWVQIKNFRANGWNESFLQRPYNERDFKDTLTSSVIPMNSPTFQIPAHNSNLIYPSPRIVMRLFEDDVVEGEKSIPGSDKIERFCVEIHIRAIIDEISNDLKACSRHLKNMLHSEQLPIKHLLVETILGELFTLPRPKHDEILYHSLLFEFTKIFQGDLRAAINSKDPGDQKNNYDIILNDAVKILYNNLETMNVTCFTRFVRWFSFHLNNYQFIYPWQTWQDATNKEPTSPKVVFVKDILDRCVRFSFHKKIQTLIQDNLSDLMPLEQSVHYKPVFADHPKAEEVAATVKKLIVDKADGPTICQTLNIKIDSVSLPDDFVLNDEKPLEQLLKIDIFTAVILHIASKSLTHMSSAIGKFRNVFKALIKVHQGQIQLLQTMHSCLETHPQLQVILVDKLLKAELVEPKEVCNWVFSESMKLHHTKSYPWEILQNTLNRLHLTVQKLEETRDKAAAVATTESSDAGVKVKKEQDEGGNTPPHDEPADVDMMPASPSQNQEGRQQMSEEDKLEAAKKEREMKDKQIEEARAAYKQLVVQVFQMFSIVISDHIKKCEQSNASFTDITYRWLTGRMQEVYYNHIEAALEMHDELRSLIEVTPTMRNFIINLNQ